MALRPLLRRCRLGKGRIIGALCYEALESAFVEELGGVANRPGSSVWVLTL